MEIETLVDVVTDFIRPRVRTLDIDHRADGSYWLELFHYDGRHEFLRMEMGLLDLWVATQPPVPSVRTSRTGRKSTTVPKKTVAEIRQMLLEEYPVLEEACLRANIVGDVQSGKSRFMMATLWMLTYHFGLRCILVLMDQTNSYKTILLRDMPLFNRWLREHGGQEYLLEMNGLQGRGSAEGDGRGVIDLCMGNHTQLAKLTQRENTAVVCDEADTLIKHWNPSRDATKSGVLFQSCVANALSVWLVTGTPFALLNQLGVSSKSWRLPKSPIYRGIHEFNIHLLDKETTDKLRNDDDAMVSYVGQIFAERSVEGRLPYKAVLVKVRWTIAAQTKLAQRFRGRVSYIANSKGPCFIKRCDEEGNITPTPFKTVSALFDSFEEMSEYREHIIIADRVASRAASFRPSPLVGDGGLCEQVYIPSASAHGAALEQGLRLSGNYSLDYPELHLHIPETAYNRIIGDKQNMTRWVDKNEEWGVAREQVKGTVFLSVGLHDRKTVDDTTLENRSKLTNRDFETLADLELYIPHKLQALPRVWMTHEEPLLVSDCPDFAYTTDREEQRRLNRQLKRGVEEDTDNSLQICWNEPRYHQLHDMRQRFGNQRRQYLCRYIVGDGVCTEPLYRVSWKAEFTSDELTLDDERWEMSVFLYRTSRGAFRFYHPSCASTDVGELTHI